MWRLHPLLGPLWTFIVTVFLGGILLGMAGSCAYDAFSPDGCQLSVEDIQELPRTAVLGVASAFLLIGGLRWASGRSHVQHEARKGFALFKAAEDLSPEDFGFQVLRSGEQADTHKRP